MEKKHKSAVLAAALAAFATMTSGVASAAAETSPAGAGVSPAAAAPSCFQLTQWDDWTATGYRSYGRVKSTCLGTYRVRFIWKWDFDGSCVQMGPGATRTEWRQGKMPSVEEIRLC